MTEAIEPGDGMRGVFRTAREKARRRLSPDGRTIARASLIFRPSGTILHMDSVYLDHNATTPLLPEAWDAMRAAPDGNPSSPHSAGRKARQALEDARERIAVLLGAQPDEVTFTSGATEANNLAVFGFLPSPRFGGEGGERSEPGEGSNLKHPSPPTPLPAKPGRGGKSPL